MALLLTSAGAVLAQAYPGPVKTGPVRIPVTQVRMSWEAFSAGTAGAARVASLKKAVTKMKSLDNSTNPVDFRRSWKYWADIHGYYGPSSPDGTVAQQTQYLQQNGMGQYVSFYNGITDQTPPDAIAQKVWATCEHSQGTGALQANFFGWHRMYLYYFEKVLRWAANDNTLRLPYWDYTNPSFEKLPAEFQQVASVMYDDKRKAGINNGSLQLNSNTTNVNTLLQDGNYLDYEYKIETGIHGYVHCTVGPTCPVAHMGDVPVAGNDPIFYEHHANIDRLWACWEKLHTTQSGAWQQQQFSFPDENGNLQTEPVSKFMDTAALGYVYDNVNACSRTTFKPIGIKLAIQLPTEDSQRFPNLVASAPSVALKQSSTSVDIALTADKVRSLTAAPSSGAAGSQLVLRDVQADTHPGALLDVYIAKKGAAGRQYVGTINWFAAFRHHGKVMPYDRTLSYDVTAQLKALGITANAPGVTVTFEATDGTVPSGSTTALRSNAATTFRPEANVRIGSIELRQAQ